MVKSCIVVLALSSVWCAPAQRGLSITSVARFDFVGGDHADPSQVAEGLSGITYLGDDQYLAVSDRHAYLHRLSIRLDPETGVVKTASFGLPLQLRDARCDPFPEPDQGPDREGLVYDARSESVWIANERTGTDPDQPSIARHSITTGCLLEELRVSSHRELQVYTNIRRNLGFEALARDSSSGNLWTANEEALRIDGERSTDSHGSVVRLQQLDARLRPLAQYAYLTDPLPAAAGEGLRRASGVADLLAPGGQLIALERALAEDTPGVGWVRIRLYHVHLDRAERLADEAWSKGLETAPYSPVPKSLLIEVGLSLESDSNFEGMTLGARLANGDHSLLLIADNDTGTKQSLYALRLRAGSE